MEDFIIVISEIQRVCFLNEDIDFDDSISHESQSINFSGMCLIN